MTRCLPSYCYAHFSSRSLGALIPSMDSNLNANNKRSANDINDYQDTNNAKRTRAAKIDLRFLLASRDAGAIIGRQGKNIQTLRSKFKTIIQVPDQDGPERILTIAGELEPSLECLTDALATMAENQKLRQDANELRALVHTSQAGAIIGKGGERVKELRVRHGLEVKVFPDTCPNSTDRVILCRGEQRAILNCLRDIFTQIEKLPPRGAVHLYDPACYSEQQIQNYGGFAADDSSVYGDRRFRNTGNIAGGPPLPPPPPPPPAPRGGGSGGAGGYNNNHYDNWEMNNTMRPAGNMYSDHYNGPPPPPPPPQSNHGFYLPPPPPAAGPPSMMGGGGGGGPHGNNPPPGPMRPLADSYNSNSSVDTQQVTIQQEFAGAIIGPRGIRISQIRQQSGALIKIDDPMPGTTDRIITIVGTPSQISQAQHLLQTAVRQSGLYSN